MTTPTLTTTEIEDLRLLLAHREAQSWLREQRQIEQRTIQRLAEAEERSSVPVVITDDAAPARGAIFKRMGDQELILAIAKLRDAAILSGDHAQVILAEHELNQRRLETQRIHLKQQAETLIR